MAIADELVTLASWRDELPKVYMQVLGGPGAPLYVFDMILIGSMKRSMSLAMGMRALVEAKNMVCARALLRMQIDTVTRLSAYSYVENREELASAVLGGAQMHRFKSTDGKSLRDAYLVDRFTEIYPWMRAVYDSTSGYVHFSESQIFDATTSLDDDTRRVTFVVGPEDTAYPEASWEEVVACFNQLVRIHVELATTYGDARRVQADQHVPADGHASASRRKASS